MAQAVESPRLFAPHLNDYHPKLLSLVTAGQLETPSWFSAALRQSALGIHDSNYHDLAYQASCLVLADLVDQGWVVYMKESRIWITPPAAEPIDGEAGQAVKARLREGLLVARDRQLAEPSVQAFIRKMEKPRLHEGRGMSIRCLIDDGSELAEELGRIASLPPVDRLTALQRVIDPVVEICDEKTKCAATGYRLQDIWRYFRHTWSLEYRPTPGRTLQILIRNRARPFSPVIGIAMLASPCSRQPLRDNWIGWTVKGLVERLTGGNWDPFHTGVLLYQTLNAAISEIKVDDLVAPEELAEPSQEVIARLRRHALEAERERLQALRESSHVGTSESESRWVAASKSPLFLKKRAATLATLLEARLRYLDAGWEHDPGKALGTLLASQAGKGAVEASLAEIRKRGLASQLLEVSVCGAVPPYNDLLGGKLVALLLASQEVSQAYAKRYGGQVSVIASQLAGGPISRPADMLLLTTTSLYAVGSSQYNRLCLRAAQHPGLPLDVAWKELGKTSGFGTAHLSRDTVGKLRELSMRVHGVRRVNNVFGEGASPRLRQIREGLAALGLDGDNILRHATPRIVYACEVKAYARERLCGRPMAESVPPTLSQLTAAWMRRWLLNRLSRPEVLARLKARALEAPAGEQQSACQMHLALGSR